MHVELVKEYRFEAAHLLPKVPPGHKCARLHGHSFRFEITVAGPVNEATGWFVDFGELDEVVMPLVNQLDHHYLNDIPGLENPTSEFLVRWLWQHMRPGLPSLQAVTLWETHDARCIYRGE